jgi:hypothetical protein
MFSPNRFDVGRTNHLIFGYEWQTQMQSSRRNDSVRHLPEKFPHFFARLNHIGFGQIDLEIRPQTFQSSVR